HDLLLAVERDLDRHEGLGKLSRVASAAHHGTEKAARIVDTRNPRFVEKTHDDAVRLACLASFGQQLLPQLGVRKTAVRADDQSSDPSARVPAQARAPVSVRLREALAWRARHEETLEHAAIDQKDLLGEYIFLVDGVFADEGHSTKAIQRGIIFDAKRRRQDR